MIKILFTTVFLFAISFVSTVHAQWASHHQMTATAYQTKFNQYTSQGYYPILVEGFAKNNTRYYNAIWEKKSGPAWVTHHGMSAEIYQQKFNAYKNQGYRLVLVDCGGGRSAFYSAIWQKKTGPAYVTHHAMTASEYQIKFNRYKTEGYRITWVSGCNVNGIDYYAAIWEKKSGSAYAAFHGMSSATYQQKFNQYTKQGYRLTCLSAHTVDNAGRFAAIFEKISGPAWSARHNINSQGYQNEFDNHLFTGYKLKQVTGYVRNGQTNYAAFWESIGVWSSSDRNHINSSIVKFMEDYDVTGASVTLLKDDRVVFSRGYGVMDKSTGVPVGTNSLFRIASVSKPITGATVMKMNESDPGLLNENVFGDSAILGNTYGTEPYSLKEKNIRISHLLHHTAGGDAWDNKDEGTGDSNPHPPMFSKTSFDHTKLIGWVLDNFDPEKNPGDKFAYSNFGYCVLGRIIEAKTGLTYEKYVRDNILKACGIDNMWIAGDKASDRRYNEVTYYGSSAYNMKVNRMDAHGGWIASSIDLSKFLVRYDGFTYKADHINTTTFNSMTTGSSANSDYGKGWSLTKSNYWHNGSISGTGAIMVRAGNGLAWVFLMNRAWDSAADGMMWNVVNGIKNWPTHDYCPEPPYSALISAPAPNITVNNSDLPIKLYSGEAINISLTLDAGSIGGKIVDYWVVGVLTETGALFSYDAMTKEWRLGLFKAYQGPLENITTLRFPSIPTATVGRLNLNFYFVIDENANGKLDGRVHYDVVKVMVR